MRTKQYRAAVLIASDRAAKGIRPDTVGPWLKIRLAELGFEVVDYRVVDDDQETITAWLRRWTFTEKVELIITSGGTGLSPRDVTPEATLQVIWRRVPGIEEAMRAASLSQTPNAMLSRGVAGVAEQSLIINLPGSPDGARHCLAVVEPVLMHALELIAGGAPDL